MKTRTYTLTCCISHSITSNILIKKKQYISENTTVLWMTQREFAIELKLPGGHYMVLNLRKNRAETENKAENIKIIFILFLNTMSCVKNDKPRWRRKINRNGHSYMHVECMYIACNWNGLNYCNKSSLHLFLVRKLDSSLSKRMHSCEVILGGWKTKALIVGEVKIRTKCIQSLPRKPVMLQIMILLKIHHERLFRQFELST